MNLVGDAIFTHFFQRVNLLNRLNLHYPVREVKVSSGIDSGSSRLGQLSYPTACSSSAQTHILLMAPWR